MKNKFFILFILIFIFGTSSVFAGIAEMDLNTATALINYAKNNMITCDASADLSSTSIRNTAIARISTANPNKLVEIFNNRFKNNVFSEDTSLNNLTCFIFYDNKIPTFYFTVTNNTTSSALDFLALNVSSNNSFTIGSVKDENSSINTVGIFYNTFGDSTVGGGGLTSTKTFYSDELPIISEDGVYLYHPSIIGLTRAQTIYYSVSDTNRKAYFVGNYISGDEVISGDYVPSFPPDESGDNSGDIGGGNTNPSGDTPGTTIPDYNEKLDNIQSGINNIENKIPTSGDIQQSTTAGVIQGNTDYWGSSGDLGGENQEELINNKIDELTDSLSGDLLENEIFGILQKYEDKIFGSFIGEEDFVISWNDVSYMGSVLIPSGEVNFSKMCRDNEALGNVKNVVNIILTFTILMNLVIYLYNLLLATLGIDNPYLYEKPVGSVTVAEYTDESGRTFVTQTQHDGRGNSITKRYDKTVVPKKRQIGFRK